ncbi:hypothetical protein EXS65_05070 [Candidatus Peribacteria bacterium]|nr:hypothetical protein [Candidatus Peribacteria bacterium]
MTETNDSFDQKEEWQLRLEQLMRETQPDILFAAAQICDGHTIWNPEVFVRAGLPEELVNHLNRVHMASASDKKWGIEGPSGHQVEACKGVYGLEFLELACEAYGIPAAPKYGRGASVRWYIEELRKKLGMPPEEPPKPIEVTPEMRLQEEQLNAVIEQFAALSIRHLAFAKFIRNKGLIDYDVRVAVARLILAYQPKTAGDLLQLFKNPKLAKCGKEMKKPETINFPWSPLEKALFEIAEKIYRLLRKKNSSLPQRSWRPEEVETKEELERVQRESLLADDIINSAVKKILGVDPGEL